VWTFRWLRLKISEVLILNRTGKGKSWSLFEDAILYRHGADLSWIELATLLPGRSKWDIRRRLSNLGIYKTAEMKSRLGQKGRSLVSDEIIALSSRTLDPTLNLHNLPERTWQMLVGSLLGDGSIKICRRRESKTRVSSSHIFLVRHGIPQSDYAQWKGQFLEDFKPVFSPRISAGTQLDGSQRFCAVTRTRVHELFGQLRTDFYGSTKYAHLVPDWCVDHLDLFGFLIWYLDDGTHVSSKRKSDGQLVQYPAPYIVRGRFSPATLSPLLTSLNRRFGISLYVQKERVYINAQSRQVLFPQWLSLADEIGLPDCMYYKLVVPDKVQIDA
jgi:hypothetical protein